MEENSNGRKMLYVILAILGVVILGLAVAATVLIINLNSSDRQLAKQLDLGQKYLEEMDYENAIIAFNKAIDIDPKNVDAYLGLVDAYEGMGDYEKALEVCRDGYDMTDSKKLEKRIAKVEKLVAQSENESENESDGDDSDSGKSDDGEDGNETVTQEANEQEADDSTITSLQTDEEKIQEAVDAYQAYIDSQSADFRSTYYEYYMCYIDDDAVPELLLMSYIAATGSILLNYYNGEVRETYIARGGFVYIPKANIFDNSDGHSGYYYDYVYTIKDGESVLVADGNWQEDWNSDTDVELKYKYYWNNEEVTYEKYRENLNKLLPEEYCLYPYSGYSSIQEALNNIIK